MLDGKRILDPIKSYFNAQLALLQ